MTNNFYGLATRGLSNAHMRIEFLVDAGPRIVRLTLAGSTDNLLAELPTVQIETPQGICFLRGGHRLWYAPETFPRTYLPDNARVQIVELSDGVRLTQPRELETGLIKSIEMRLDATRAAVTLTHRLQNVGAQPIECAPWAITQLPLGGVAILPQTAGALDARGLLPNRNFSLWPYTRINDPRLEWRDEVVLVHARAQLPACKIGYFNHQGWIGYWRDQVFFVKRFTPQAQVAYPDFNCNAEVYCNDQFIELETLAPLTTLLPEQTATHTETWELYAGIPSAARLPDKFQFGA